MNGSIQDIQERLSRLEAQVARLAEQMRASHDEAPSVSRNPSVPTPPAPPRASHIARPAPAVPKPPRKPANPVIYIAGAGAGIFLIGAIFFLYWSIEQGWIGPEMRFLMGLTVGGGLALGAAKLIQGAERTRPWLAWVAGLAVVILGFAAWRLLKGGTSQS